MRSLMPQGRNARKIEQSEMMPWTEAAEGNNGGRWVGEPEAGGITCSPRQRGEGGNLKFEI